MYRPGERSNQAAAITRRLSAAVHARRGAMTYREAAEQSGVDAATLLRIENQHRLPDLVNFVAVCRWANLDPASILGLDNSERSSHEATLLVSFVERVIALGDDFHRIASEAIPEAMAQCLQKKGKAK